MPRSTRISPPSSWARPARPSPSPSSRPGANRTAHLLRAAGLKRGDHIAVFMENSIRMLEIEGAAERTGLYFTLINTYLAPDEVAYIVTNSRVADAVQLGRPARPVAQAAAANCPDLERMLMTGPGDPPAGWESYEAADRAVPGPTRSRTSRSARPCCTRPARPGSPRASCATCRRCAPQRAAPGDGLRAGDVRVQARA